MFLEHGTPAEHYSTLALELAKHNIRAGDGKLLHLTATPRCGFPDARVKEALDTGIFERVHVRFYDDNPDCAAGFSAVEYRSGASGRRRTRSPSSMSACRRRRRRLGAGSRTP
jgi:chitinase